MRFTSLTTLPLPLLRALRLMRHAAYVALDPLDYVARRINGKRGLPPLHLRRHVGPLRSFESSGAEFLAYLRLLAGLQPDEKILDIGCGCGLMAITLKDFLSPDGRYVGVDVHQSSINWSRRNIQSRNSNFEFLHLKSNGSAHEFLPFPDRAFDVILLKSVFTHLRPAEVDVYLGEVARLLSGRGRCLATFFLLNEKQDELKRRGLNEIAFDFGDETARFAYEHSPKSAMAFRETFIMELLEKHQLSLRQPIFYGRWSGLAEGMSFQDMLLIQRRTA